MLRNASFVLAVVWTTSVAGQSAPPQADIARLLGEERLRGRSSQPIIGVMSWCPLADTVNIACDSLLTEPTEAARAASASLAADVAASLGQIRVDDLPSKMREVLPPVPPGTSGTFCTGELQRVEAFTPSRIKETIAGREWRVIVQSLSVPVRRECMSDSHVAEYVFERDAQGKVVLAKVNGLLHQTVFLPQ